MAKRASTYAGGLTRLWSSGNATKSMRMLFMTEVIPIGLHFDRARITGGSVKFFITDHRLPQEPCLGIWLRHALRSRLGVPCQPVGEIKKGTNPAFYPRRSTIRLT